MNEFFICVCVSIYIVRVIHSMTLINSGRLEMLSMKMISLAVIAL